MRAWMLGGLLAGTGVCAAELGPYQVIIDKSPFGGLASKAVTVATPASLTRYAFVGLVETEEGRLQAIIQDKQTQQCYFKVEGESVEDVQVQKIEQGGPAPRLVLRRGVETGTLTYEQPKPVAASPPPVAPVPGGAPAVPPTEPSRRIPFRR